MSRTRVFSIRRLLVVSFVALTCAAGPARAGLVTWEFAGTITNVDDPTNLLGGAVTIGTPFSGSFTFDPSTPDSEPGDPLLGMYDNAIVDVLGEVGGLPFAGPNGITNVIEVRDFPSFDAIRAKADVGFIAETLDLSVTLLDDTATLFSTDDLIAVPPDLNLLDLTQFLITDTSEQIPLVVAGDVTALVPEPGTLLLFGVGLIVCSRQRSRRRLRHNGKPNDHLIALPQAARLTLAITMAWSFGVTGSARAVDCNRNGVDDASELAACPVAELVFVIDTSASMGDPLPFVCSEIQDAIADLGSTATAEILQIGPGGQPCSCCTSDVPAVYCDPPDPFGRCDELADCALEETRTIRPGHGPQSIVGRPL